MTIYHNHHIVPKHCGGTDDASNLIRLTIKQHAEAHKELWEEHGRWEDYVAWQGLSGQISKQEIIKLAQIEGGKKSQKMYPQKPSTGGTALWTIPGMREHLVEKRKEQSRMGKNPMQGKKQNRVCCVNCKNVISVNVLILHQKKCVKF
jgi:hypothetical protein